MRKVFIFNIGLLFFQLTCAQYPAIQWQNTIGGNAGDKLIVIHQTYDGGYILGGYSYSGISGDKTEDVLGAFRSDYWIVKLDSMGEIEWQNTIGGDLDDELYDIQETYGGGYIVGGTSYSNISGDKTESNFSYEPDYWIIKLDTIGNIEWQNTIGANGAEYLQSIRQTFDGGYIVGGTSTSDISGDKTEAGFGVCDYWLLKLDTSGVIEWQRTIGGNAYEALNVVRQTLDGGYFLAGTSQSDISGWKTENSVAGSQDYWVLKLDTVGEIVWQNTIGGDGMDWLYCADRTADNGYILGGFSYSGISGDKTEVAWGSGDFWVIKINTSGEIEWQSDYGGFGTDVMNAVQQTNDGGYIIGGYTSSGITGNKTEICNGFFDYWVIKLDGDGLQQWQHSLGGTSENLLFSLGQTNDDGYILGGYSSSGISGDKTEISQGDYDYWVIKLYCDSALTFYADLDEDLFGDALNPYTTCDGFMPAGFVENNTDCNDADASIYPGAPELLDGLDNNCNDSIDEGMVAIGLIQSNLIIHCYPNPAFNFLTIETDFSTKKTIYLTDALGQIVQTINSSENIITINLNNISSGIYFIKMEDGIHSTTQKFVKQ